MTSPRSLWRLAPEAPRRGRRRWAAGLGALALLAASALADVVHTKDGRRLEGRLIEETAAHVVIETRFGRVKVARDDIRELVRQKEPRVEFEERFAKAKDVAALLALAKWAGEHELTTESRKCLRRVLELDPDDETANVGLGNVRYKGRWMTPKERDAARAEDEAAERRAAGLVEHEGRWVTPEDRDRLVRGLVLYEGEWLTLAEAKARQGLAELDGDWIPMHAAAAVAHMREVAKAAGVACEEAFRPTVAVAGPWPRPFLEEIAAGLERGRAIFDAEFEDAPAGVELLGGRAAEFYVWNRDSQPYLDTIPILSALTTTVGDAWRASVRDTHGWVFWDPYPISSVRAVSRPEFHLAGHCYYHLGHVLLNRHRYDGRLLPPWFNEGYAGLLEWGVHGKNTVVLKAGALASAGGTVAKGKEPPFGRAALTRGDWKVELRRALTDGDARLVPFDTLARKSPGELTAVDVAMSMGIVHWIERAGGGALQRFHAELKRTAPPAPMQTYASVAERLARYDAAFEAAMGLDMRTSDRAWRAWFVAEAEGDPSKPRDASKREPAKPGEDGR